MRPIYKGALECSLRHDRLVGFCSSLWYQVPEWTSRIPSGKTRQVVTVAGSLRALNLKIYLVQKRSNADITAWLQNQQHPVAILFWTRSLFKKEPIIYRQHIHPSAGSSIKERGFAYKYSETSVSYESIVRLNNN